MKFAELRFPGAYLIEIEPKVDDRGYFARTFCSREFEKRGLCTNFVQCNISGNSAAGTLRGMHFQRAPHAEAKLIRCAKGRVFDVLVDVRPESRTYRKWQSVELSETTSVYIPPGFAHGFITLEDNTEVFYQMSSEYVEEASAGFQWDDPEIGIEWPTTPKVVSHRDANLPSFRVLFKTHPAY